VGSCWYDVINSSSGSIGMKSELVEPNFFSFPGGRLTTTETPLPFRRDILQFDALLESSELFLGSIVARLVVEVMAGVAIAIFIVVTCSRARIYDVVITVSSTIPPSLVSISVLWNIWSLSWLAVTQAEDFALP